MPVLLHLGRGFKMLIRRMHGWKEGGSSTYKIGGVQGDMATRKSPKEKSWGSHVISTSRNLVRKVVWSLSFPLFIRSWRWNFQHKMLLHQVKTWLLMSHAIMCGEGLWAQRFVSVELGFKSCNIIMKLQERFTILFKIRSWPWGC